jgi:hypothetical protein
MESLHDLDNQSSFDVVSNESHATFPEIDTRFPEPRFLSLSAEKQSELLQSLAVTPSFDSIEHDLCAWNEEAWQIHKQRLCDLPKVLTELSHCCHPALRETHPCHDQVGAGYTNIVLNSKEFQNGLSTLSSCTMKLMDLCHKLDHCGFDFDFFSPDSNEKNTFHESSGEAQVESSAHANFTQETMIRSEFCVSK